VQPGEVADTPGVGQKISKAAPFTAQRAGFSCFIPRQISDACSSAWRSFSLARLRGEGCGETPSTSACATRNENDELRAPSPASLRSAPSPAPRERGYTRPAFGPLAMAIGSRALDVLGVLVGRARDLVSGDEIIATVWPATWSRTTI
jgi:hypothetical protein